MLLLIGPIGIIHLVRANPPTYPVTVLEVGPSNPAPKLEPWLNKNVKAIVVCLKLDGARPASVIQGIQPLCAHVATFADQHHIPVFAMVFAANAVDISTDIEDVLFIPTSNVAYFNSRGFAKLAHDLSLPTSAATIEYVSENVERKMPVGMKLLASKFSLRSPMAVAVVVLIGVLMLFVRAAPSRSQPSTDVIPPPATCRGMDELQTLGVIDGLRTEKLRIMEEHRQCLEEIVNEHTACDASIETLRQTLSSVHAHQTQELMASMTITLQIELEKLELKHTHLLSDKAKAFQDLTVIFESRLEESQATIDRQFWSYGRNRMHCKQKLIVRENPLSVGASGSSIYFSNKYLLQ